MLNMSPEMIHGIKTNTDAFVALSKIAFSSVEQLTTLNLRTTRTSLEESAAAASSLLESNGTQSSSKTTRKIPLVAGESAADYFRGVNDIATEACHETTKLMTAYFASPYLGLSDSAAWFNGFEAFNGFGQKLSAFTEANSKAMADVTKRVVNQTNALSRKSA